MISAPTNNTRKRSCIPKARSFVGGALLRLEAQDCLRDATTHGSQKRRQMIPRGGFQEQMDVISGIGDLLDADLVL